MEIIILGAGQVGSTLAENLVLENNDVTVVDIDEGRLTILQNRLDIRTVVGSACYPNILYDAGAENADMIIAVTSNDESNMIACQVGYSIFNTPTKIARIRAPQYFFIRPEKLFCKKGMPIDFFINPESLVTKNIYRLIQHPGALQVLDFAEGKVQLVAIKSYYGGPLVGKSLSELYEYMETYETRVAAIYRKNKALPLNNELCIEVGDEVFFIAASKNIKHVMSVIRRQEPYRNIMISGGGNIGLRLARRLENEYNVKIIDHNRERCHVLANELNTTTVLLGESADRSLLVNENIENMDVFCAVTNDDEANIMSALLAKKLGARQVMALIKRSAYIELLEGGAIDIVISPQQITIGGILTHLHHCDLVSAQKLRLQTAEIIEVVAHGDEDTSKVVGNTLAQLTLPPGAIVGAIVRGDKVFIGRNDIRIESDDHIILFIEKDKYLRDIERLFQVKATFL